MLQEHDLLKWEAELRAKEKELLAREAEIQVREEAIQARDRETRTLEKVEKRKALIARIARNIIEDLGG